MRVITGTARGKRLVTLEGESVRPTSDRVKEALFNIIQFQVEGRRVLDLFAGSGQLGIEALSRGAAEAVFVDSGKGPVKVIQSNLESTGLGGSAQVYALDSAAFLLRKTGKYDIAFLDPPYRSGLLQRVLPMTAEIMNTGGVILCEHPQDETLPEEAGCFVRTRSYRYGKILLTLYRHRDLAEVEIRGARKEDAYENSDLPGEL